VNVYAVTLLAALTGCTTPGGERELFTIHCMQVGGANQYTVAESWAKALRDVPGLDAKRVRVAYDADGAHVCYGEYERVYDQWQRREFYRPDPKHDLELIRSLSPDNRQRPFALALVQALPPPAGAHPEWDADRVGGYWALQVAVFYSTETFRQPREAAVEYCAQLRNEGYEAYYAHKGDMSMVVIGSFSKLAVQNMQTDAPTPEGGTSARSENRIVDPRLRALMAKFPHNLENGHKVSSRIRNPQTNAEELVPRPSFPVVLPRAARAEEAREGGGVNP
jgi:hypothetical protein